MDFMHWIVLVVEDEADSMELVVELLAYHGIRTIPASSAEEALMLLEDTMPTLIIIDLALPGMNGWDLLRHLQRHKDLDRVPRVAVTAYHTAEIANQAIEAGFDAYFAKPLEATSFVRELEGIVEG
jgi:CheY-like chemotaxis protein